MAGNREFMLVSMNRDLPCAEDFACGSTILKCLTLHGVRTSHYVIEGEVSVTLPAVHDKAVLLQHPHGGWQTVICSSKRSIDRVRCFLVHGISQGPVGIRTSQDWNTTHWGIRLPGKADVWLVPCALPECFLEFKAVCGSDDNLTWEPHPFINKVMDLSAESQIIELQWGTSRAVDKAADVLVYKKCYSVSITIDPDIDAFKLLRFVPGYNLMLVGVKDSNNRLVYPKGHQIPARWSDCYEAFSAVVVVHGNQEIVRFSLAIMDDLNVVTHVDRNCFMQDGPRYRELNVFYQDTVHCGNFVDVRPMKWRTDSTSVCPPPIGTPARSLYNLIYHSPSPKSHSVSPLEHYDSEMSLYRDIMLGNVPMPNRDEGQSPELVQKKKSVISRAKSLSFKHVREKLTPKKSSQQFDNDEYTPKTTAHTDSVTGTYGKGLLDYLYNVKGTK